MRKSIITLFAVVAGMLAFFPAIGSTAEKADEKGFVSLFNGKDFTGWKISDNGSWRVEDGKIVACGGRSHLFTKAEYKNFEFKADVMTTPGSNSGIYFHTKFLESGWPVQGYESQVNVTHGDPVKSGSLYNVVKVYETPAKDNEWNQRHIIVRGKNIVVKINGKTVIDYTEPAGVTSPIRLSKGSFALQAHDPKSVTYYRNLRVKKLAD